MNKHNYNKWKHDVTKTTRIIFCLYVNLIKTYDTCKDFGSTHVMYLLNPFLRHPIWAFWPWSHFAIHTLEPNTCRIWRVVPSNLLIYTPGSREFIIWQRRWSDRDWFDTVFVGWFLTIDGSLKYLTHQVKIWVAKIHRKNASQVPVPSNVSQVPLRFFEPQDLCNSTDFIAARWSFQMYHFFKALYSNPPLGGWSACLFEKCAL